MPDWRDEDDWVGEPPEGHHSRDRAKPEYWRTVRLTAVAGAGVIVAVVVLVVVLLS